MKTKTLILILSFLILFGIAFIVIKKEKTIIEEPIPVKLTQPEFFLSDEPTDSLVLQACEYYGIKHPKIVLAQAILETGHYQSGGCKYDKNLFGLYNSKKGEFFKFDKWYQSVEAYRNKIQYRYDGTTDYYKWLEQIGYAEDTLYTQKLKQIIKRYLNE